MDDLRRDPAQPSVRGVRVVVVDGPDRARGAEASGARVTVGTSPDNALVVTDPTVSRCHVEVWCEDGISVKDLGSRTGTFAGEIRIREAAVPNGSRLKLGGTVIVVTEVGLERGRLPIRAQAPVEGTARGPTSAIAQYRAARAAALATFEREYLCRLIDATNGNASAAARAANMDRPYLLSLLRRHGLR